MLLVLEFLCLFGPAIALLGLGLIFLGPLLMGAIIGAQGDWLLGAVVVICGSWGVLSAANLGLHLVTNRKWLGKPVQLFGLSLGVAACGISAFAVQDGLASLVFAGPVIATIHFLFLARAGRALPPISR